jgi:hypothetical protein
LFGLNPSGSLPIASSFLLDFAVTSLKLCSSFLDAWGASISDSFFALGLALGFAFACTLGGFSMFSYSASSFSIYRKCKNET